MRTSLTIETHKEWPRVTSPNEKMLEDQKEVSAYYIREDCELHCSDLGLLSSININEAVIQWKETRKSSLVF